MGDPGAAAEGLIGHPPQAAGPQARRAAEELARLSGVERYDALVVLGSGWAGALEALLEGARVHWRGPSTTVPGFLAPVAPGHPGELVSLTGPTGTRVLVQSGRTHVYEGHGMAPVVHAVRVAAATGARVALLTNANGSLRADWGTGTPVLLRDHLNPAFATPLVGPHFPDLSDCWSPRLRGLALAAAGRRGIAAREGVYAFVPGPQYQSRAEALMLRAAGADVVGMSTVMEAIAARDAGLELLGVSVVTTVELDAEPNDPQEVVRVAEASAHLLGPVLRDVLDGLPHA